MRRLHRWVIVLAAVGALWLTQMVPMQVGAASVGGSGHRPTAPTKAATATVTPTETPTATSTPLERCGRYGCAILTPSPAALAPQAPPTAAPPAGPAPTTVTVTCDWTDPTSWAPCLLAAIENMANGWLNDIDSGLNLLTV